LKDVNLKSAPDEDAAHARISAMGNFMT
jgi:hypothetical protein